MVADATQQGFVGALAHVDSFSVYLRCRKSAPHDQCHKIPRAQPRQSGTEFSYLSPCINRCCFRVSYNMLRLSEHYVFG